LLHSSETGRTANFNVLIKELATLVNVKVSTLVWPTHELFRAGDVQAKALGSVRT
jgi:hypothetical protein